MASSALSSGEPGRHTAPSDCDRETSSSWALTAQASRSDAHLSAELQPEVTGAESTDAVAAGGCCGVLPTGEDTLGLAPPCSLVGCGVGGVAG